MLERFVIAVERIAAALERQQLSQGEETTDVAPKEKTPRAAKVKAEAVKPEVIKAEPIVKTEPAAEPPPAFSYDTLKASVIELANAGAEGKAAAINVLTRFGVKKASELDPDKWEALNAAMQEELTRLNGDEDDLS